MNRIALNPKRTSYWLLVRDGEDELKILCTDLAGGLSALAVFSFEEEADMFLCLRGGRDGWRVREATADELLSLLHTLPEEVSRVNLDPIPENSFLNASGLLSINRSDFVIRLKRACSDALTGNTRLNPVS